MMLTGFDALAVPTARDAPGARISRAMSMYDAVSPTGMRRSAAQSVDVDRVDGVHGPAEVVVEHRRKAFVVAPLAGGVDEAGLAHPAVLGVTTEPTNGRFDLYDIHAHCSTRG